MSEPVVRHQLFEYDADEPFHVFTPPLVARQGDGMAWQLLHHWHEELEMVYVLNGRSLHYIDGECVEGIPGRLVVTNCGSPHNIILKNEGIEAVGPGGIVLLIHDRFLAEQFPQYQDIYFTNEKMQARPEIGEIMFRLSGYAEQQTRVPHDSLYAKGLILQLLYYMCEEGTARRHELDINVQKNVERLKGVLSYLENHYHEPVSQAQVAKKFYFNREYFSRYFKKYTGMTFTEYLVRYRLHEAKRRLEQTDLRVTDIAMECGFSDDRRLIEAFKKYCGITPHKYRIIKKQEKTT